MERLGREDILRALAALGQEVGGGATHELYLVGGAALVLLYGARESTKDVDAFSLSPTTTAALRAAAERVALRHGLPADWLNDAAKGYVQGVSPGPVLLETPCLRVRTVAPEQLLAMKLSAWRDDVDIEDAGLLLDHLEGDKEDTWARVEPHVVPGRELKARYAFEDLWEAAHGSA